MTYSLSNNCTKNYYNRTLTVQVIVEDVVTWIFLKHSVLDSDHQWSGVTLVTVSVRFASRYSLSAGLQFAFLAVCNEKVLRGEANTARWL